MTKKVFLISTLIATFLIGCTQLFAATTGVVEPAIGLVLRTIPDTSKLDYKIMTIPQNATIIILDTIKNDDTGCKTWYKATYSEKTGYVCAEFVKDIKEDPTEPTEPEEPLDVSKMYEEELKKFPTDYQNKIKALHSIYPNAVFKAKNITGVSWGNFLTYQYQGYTNIPGCPYSIEKGISLYWDNNRTLDGRKSTDSWAYNYYTNVFNQNFTGGGSNWYIPSKNTVSYYLDPRNFLNTSNIFMFEDQTYNEGYYTIDNINKMLVGTFMYNTKIEGIENKTYAEAFLDAGKQSKVSPYALASRVIQELGVTATKPVMVSGTYPGYVGYYNFYNIGAYGNSNTETIKNGLQTAKNNGWNTEYKALLGGAKFVGDGYINAGQNTLYSQKFDTDGPCFARHQYMQNIQAPESEGYKIYQAYQNAKLQNSNFVFIIPVYTGMPTNTTLDNPKNPNNYLKELTINGSLIDGFDASKTEYEINVSPLISTVEIAASKVASTSNISGTGKITLTGTSKVVEVKVTAANSSVKTYKITITRKAEIPIAISEILNTMRINSDGTYISAIALGTTAQNFIDRAKEVSPSDSTTIEIKNIDGKIKTNELLGTGDQVKITSGNETKTFTVVIYGDLTGDGIINSGDLLKLRQHLIGTISLKDAYWQAGNATKDEVINSGDLLKLRQHLIGSSAIEQ